MTVAQKLTHHLVLKQAAYHGHPRESSGATRAGVLARVGRVQALTAKKVPELVDAVQDAAAEPGKAVSKAVKQVLVCDQLPSLRRASVCAAASGVRRRRFRLRGHGVCSSLHAP